MANFAENDNFPSVEKLETTELVLGGDPTSPSNKAAKALTERTAWLKARLGGYTNANFVTVSGNGSVTLTAANINRVFIYTVADNTAATYAITLPDPSTVKAGSRFKFVIRNNDTSILKITVASDMLFNNEVAEVVSNGVDAWTFIVVRTNPKTDRLIAVTEDMGSGNTRIRLRSMSSFYLLDASHSTANVKEIKFLGDILPRSGTKITIYFPSDANLHNDGNVRLLTNSTSGGGANRYPIKGQEFREFVFDTYDDDNWYITASTADNLVLSTLDETSTINISGSQFNTVKNWLNKLIAVIQSRYDQGSWTTITAQNGFTNVSDTAKYRVDSKRVSLRGWIDASTAASSWSTGHFATLPVGVRPAVNLQFPIITRFPSSDASLIGILSILDDGRMRIITTTGLSIYDFAYLDGIEFFIN